jgi:hypothetical protein
MISDVEQFVPAAWLVPSVVKRLSDRNGSNNTPAIRRIVREVQEGNEKKSRVDGNRRRRENGRREDKRK